MFRIEFHLSYQDQVCYDVYGHDTVRQIETYNANPYTLNYMRESFNHNGDATAFERNILSRQGGAVIRAVHGIGAAFPLSLDAGSVRAISWASCTACAPIIWRIMRARWKNPGRLWRPPADAPGPAPIVL